MNKLFPTDPCVIFEKYNHNKENGTLITKKINKTTTSTEKACYEIDYNLMHNKAIIMLNKYHNTLLDFVINDQKQLILGSTHCCLSDYRNVYGAGRLKINILGFIYFLDNMSGHYKPKPNDCLLIYKFFQENFAIDKNCVFYLIDEQKTEPANVYYNQMITQNFQIYQLTERINYDNIK